MRKAKPRTGLVVADVVLWPLVACIARWARRREAAIVQSGTALTAGEMTMARAAGVALPERVRVLAVDVVPMPLPMFIRGMAERLGVLSPDIAGMTLGYGIVLHHAVRHDRAMLVHEFAHVAQVEYLGGLYRFLRCYVRECLWPGYPRGPLEMEARRVAAGVATQSGENVIPYQSMAGDRP